MSQAPTPEQTRAADEQALPAPVLDYTRPGADSLVTIRTYGDQFEANLAIARLDAEGIPTALADENMVALGSGVYTNMLGGIKLQVRRDDVDRALALLPGRRAEREVRCPKCKSADIHRSHWMGMRGLWVVLFAGLPLVFTEAPCRCRACGWRFTVDDEDDDDEPNGQDQADNKPAGAS